METQQDNQIRMVALANLRAMCAHVSGTCHRYWVENVSKTRVKVGYSNPDEYANDGPVYAVFPCYPSVWPGDEENPRVVLDVLRIIGTNEDWGAQCFDILTDCPTLFREPQFNEWDAREAKQSE